MNRTNEPLSRRTVLRGLGAAIGLPLLEAMLPRGANAGEKDARNAKGKKGGTALTPTRMACVALPNGFWMNNFTPQALGANFDLQPSLKPLSSVKDDFMVLSGLALDNGWAHGDGAGDHARAGASFLTGAHPKKTAGSNIRNGISVDQVAAQQVGQSTRLPSLELGCDRGQRAGDCDSGYSCAYVANISWASESQPMPKLIDPALVFDRLFGTSSAHMDAAKRLAERRSILDYVADDAKRLNERVGSADKHKLDEFSTSLREVERRIQQAQSTPPPKPPADFPRPNGIPRDYTEHMRLMYDLLVLAFRMDLTRVATFMVASEGSNRSFPWLGINGGHHELSHHGKNRDKIEAIKKIDLFHMTQFAYFLEKLKQTRDGERSLLDNCMIMAGSGIGDGDAHNHDNLPVILAGRGGAVTEGAVKSGRHVRYAKNTPLCNLYLAMLQRMGATAERFGDSTEPLEQLSA